MSSQSQKPALLKEYAIETKERIKQLCIYRGNILEQESDIIGITVYDHQENYGQLFKDFMELNRNRFPQERTILSDSENSWVGVSSSDEITPRHVFFIHSPIEEGESFTIRELSSLLRLTFSSMSTFLYEGNQGRTVSLPVLFRKGNKDNQYSDYISSFIYESARFLRKNNSIDSLHICIWHQEDIHHWEKILNDQIPPLSEQETSKAEVKKLLKKIELELSSTEMTKIIPVSIIKSLLNEVKHHTINLWKLSSASDQLINSITDCLCRLDGVPKEFTEYKSFKRLRNIKKHRILVEWFVDYMLSVKTFKNFVVLNKVSPTDQYLYLLQLLQIIIYSKELFITTGGNKIAK